MKIDESPHLFISARNLQGVKMPYNEELLETARRLAAIDNEDYDRLDGFVAQGYLLDARYMLEWPYGD